MTTRSLVTLPPILLEELSRYFKAEVKSMHSVSGGCINNAAIVAAPGPKYYFLKWNPQAPEGFFASEAFGLNEIAKADVIKVPEVIFCADRDKAQVPYLLLELLSSGEATPAGQKELGERLARLHQVKAESYGLEQNNFIGSLPQDNSEADNWGEFFFKQRLVKQAEIGTVSGWFDYNFERLLNDKMSKIIEVLNEVTAEGASLLHGDLWSGNVYWSKEGAVLIDPAVYYGHREADIAFTELFGGFDQSFYQGYQSVFPLEPGYHQRKHILNLYHQMTHANLFGGEYVSSAYSTLTRI